MTDYQGHSISDRSPDRPSVALDPMALRALAERQEDVAYRLNSWATFLVGTVGKDGEIALLVEASTALREASAALQELSQVESSVEQVAQSPLALPALLDANEALMETSERLVERVIERDLALAALREQLAAVEALRALSKDAEPGPWSQPTPEPHDDPEFGRHIEFRVRELMVEFRDKSTARFIVDACNAVRKVIDDD